jgi:predicted metal-dependent peptidase
MSTQEEILLQRAHVRLMRHTETYLYAGVILMGKSTVTDSVPTAATNGRDVLYGREFVKNKTIEQMTYVVLHETLHKFLKHSMRHGDLYGEDPKLANVSADYVVNDIIENLTDKTLVARPTDHPPLYDPKFHDWSVREVYNFLKTGQNKDGKQEGKPQPKQGQPSAPTPDKSDQSDKSDKSDQPGTPEETKEVQIGGRTYRTETMDDHDQSLVETSSDEELSELSAAIDDVVQQAALMSGMQGKKMPRALTGLLKPKVDWKEVLREFVSNHCKGKDEYTWRRLNMRRVVDEIYMPSVESEAVDEIIVAIDTSGSISPRILAEFAAELASICETVLPRAVRVLWWDTRVAGEQLFQDDYGNIHNRLHPQGGGGTHVTCVSNYIIEKNLNAECLILLTDGYVENDINWRVALPTLWLVTENTSFMPPANGKMVNTF